MPTTRIRSSYPIQSFSDVSDDEYIYSDNMQLNYPDLLKAINCVFLSIQSSDTAIEDSMRIGKTLPHNQKWEGRTEKKSSHL
jgi:hypothetical protein